MRQIVERNEYTKKEEKFAIEMNKEWSILLRDVFYFKEARGKYNAT